jgi:hypothetical protein
MEMTLHTTLGALAALTVSAIGFAAPALAQDAAGDIEDGDDTRASASYSANGNATTSSTSDIRIGLQIRLDALNVLGPIDTSGTASEQPSAGIARRLLVPLAAIGVRLVDQRLFIGAGFGFYGWSTEDDPGNEVSKSGFGLSPLVQFDVLRETAGALSLGGALHIASLSETEACDPDGDCMELNDGGTAVGLSLGAGIRGFITPGLAIGGDLGWGFLSYSADDDSSAFVHGIYAALLFEATIGV